jgi:hypothetical protein
MIGHTATKVAIALTVLCSAVPRLWAAEEAKPEKLVHPYLVYQSEDRAKLLAHVQNQWSTPRSERGKDYIADALRDCYGGAFENHLRPDYIYEGPKSWDMFSLAMATWMAPGDKRPPHWFTTGKVGNRTPEPPLDTFLGYVRFAVPQISVPTRRIRDYFPGEGSDKPGPWGFFLDAGETLWRHALAYDLLSAPEVAKAGLQDAVLQEYYTRIADGIFHQLVEHMRSYNVQGPRWGNNWNSREMSGVGLACLSFRDRFEKEPAGSQRHRDFDDALRLLGENGRVYMKGWNYSSKDPEFAWYYEGPHYLRYWSEFFTVFAHAYERMYPNSPYKELTLAGDQPLARFLRGSVFTVMPTNRDKSGKGFWGTCPVDDCWENQEYPQMQLAAAWLGEKNPADRDLFLGILAKIHPDTHNLLLGTATEDALHSKQPMPKLPLLMAMPYGGIAVARTSWEDDGLSVLVKNTLVNYGKDGKPDNSSHCHVDSSEVVAYSNFEPVLIDPGYGPKGYGNPDRYKFACNPEQHNTLLVEDHANPSTFVLPTWPDDASQPKRISRHEQMTDQLGAWSLVEASTPAGQRTMLLVDGGQILVIDRMTTPRRVQLNWFANGCADGDAPTAKMDLAQVTAEYFRGQTRAERISVVMPGTLQAVAAPGAYGPSWGSPGVPITGLRVVSEKPVSYAVTLIEVAAKADATAKPAFSLAVKAQENAQGHLEKVTVTGPKGAVTYQVAADGAVTRSR